MEWLPWVGRHDMETPADITEWSRILRRRFDRKNRELGIDSPHAMEVFTVSAWGEIADVDVLLADIPGIVPAFSNLEALRARLDQWRGDAG